MPDELFDAISDLVVNDEDFRALSEKQDVYCPFEALSVASMEIRHSNFLADLLTPSATHNFGDRPLRVIADALLEAAGETEARLNCHLADLSGAEVLREWRNIDLVIRIPDLGQKNDLILVLEIKIESSEHGDQLQRYSEVVRETWPKAQVVRYFLSPDGTESSQDDWIDLAFPVVIDALEQVTKEDGGHPHARMMVEAYVGMMRRRYVTDEELALLSENIWKKHGRALETLIRFQPNPASNLATMVAEEDTLKAINARLEQKGFNLNVVLDAPSRRLVRFAVKDWDAFEGMKSAKSWTKSNRIFLLEVEIAPDYIGARWVVGRGEPELRKAIISLIDKASIQLKRGNKITPEFTRIGTKPLSSRSEMKKLLENLDESALERVRNFVANYAANTIGPLDVALRNGIGASE